MFFNWLSPASQLLEYWNYSLSHHVQFKLLVGFQIPVPSAY